MTQLSRDVLRLLAPYSIYIALAVDELGHLGINKCIEYKTLRIEHDNTKGWKISLNRDSVEFPSLFVNVLGQVEIGDTPEKIDRLKVIRTKHVRALVEAKQMFGDGEADIVQPVSFKLHDEDDLDDDTKYSGFLIPTIQLIVYWIPVESVQSCIYVYDPSYPGGYILRVKLYSESDTITMNQVAQIIGGDRMTIQ